MTSLCFFMTPGAPADPQWGRRHCRPKSLLTLHKLCLNVFQGVVLAGELTVCWLWVSLRLHELIFFYNVWAFEAFKLFTDTVCVEQPLDPKPNVMKTHYSEQMLYLICCRKPKLLRLIHNLVVDGVVTVTHICLLTQLKKGLVVTQ